MAGEYKAPCGCKIHVIQWTAKRKVVTQESCPLHKAASELLAALKDMFKAADEIAEEFIKNKRAANWGIINNAYLKADAAISKAEGK